ncbi:MAG: hypothetical protein HZC24_02715 [Rhodocyclales bacterium]|nr:hypothetical protein [Rhodocyclales bacterium]
MSMRFAVGFTWGLLLQCLSITSATAALQPEEQAALVDGLKSIQQAADIPDAIKQRLPKYQDVTTQEYAIPHTSLMLHTFIERYVQANKRITVGVVAVTGIPDMSLFGVGLKAPVLFWTKRTGDEGNDVTLRMEAMPPQLKQYVAQKLGMPNAVLAQRGLNVLGRFGAGAVDEFIESITNYKLENFLVGVAKAKAGADQADSNAKTGYAMTLSMAAQTPWTNPFGLSDTELAGGTVRMTTGDKSRLIEAWGTAKLGPDKKAFTFYVKNTYAGKLSTSQSLGFDVDDASLKDFFMVLGVLEKTLGLPQVPMPKLRLDLVHLQNPAWRALSDPGAPLDFNTMMFKGTRETAGLGELKSNVRGTIFGQPVAEIALNASKKNVIGSAKLAAKLGPLKAESADFHLNAGETTAPDVGIAVRSSVFGELDLKVSDKGLELAIPAACPLRPLGLHGTLDSLAVADFPITPEFADCYSKALGDFVNGVADTADLAADGARRSRTRHRDHCRRHRQGPIDHGGHRARSRRQSAFHGLGGGIDSGASDNRCPGRSAESLQRSRRAHQFPRG